MGWCVGCILHVTQLSRDCGVVLWLGCSVSDCIVEFQIGMS